MPNRTLVVAKSTFEPAGASGETARPGDVLCLTDEQAGRYVRLLLCEPPRPAVHEAVEAVEEGPPDSRRTYLIHHYGGGYYWVADAEGRVLTDTGLQGRKAALAFVADHANEPAEVEDDAE